MSYLPILRESSQTALADIVQDLADKDGTEENAEDGLGMGEDEEEEEIARGTVSFGEHAFQFEKFEQVGSSFARVSRCEDMNELTARLT